MSFLGESTSATLATTADGMRFHPLPHPVAFGRFVSDVDGNKQNYFVCLGSLSVASPADVAV